MKQNLSENHFDHKILSRRERRAMENKGANSKRDIMRRWVAALSKYANDRNDWAVKKSLEEFMPYVRLENPESKGLDAAYKKLVKYGHGVEADIYAYVKEVPREERGEKGGDNDNG